MTTLDGRRHDFPILDREIRPGQKLIYLDSAATSQKPDIVLKAMDDYYRLSNANIHRGVHFLAEEATAKYEAARVAVGRFVNAPSSREVVYVRNTTEAINLVAYTWGQTHITAGDVIGITAMEHHSNIVPWHMLAARTGARIFPVAITPDGEIEPDSFAELLKLAPKLVCFTHVSNVLGTINPVRAMTAQAHAAGALVLVDGAQAVPHMPVDVQELGVDFYAFSSHKMCGPTGIGILWARETLLEAMPPFMGGGDMIRRVTLDGFRVNDLPHKFEAGTPAIAEAVGLGAAVEYLNGLGMSAVAEHERDIIAYALERLEEVPGLEIQGPPADRRGGVAAFSLEGAHPHDIAQILDARGGIAIRAGHHCAQPLHDILELSATARASFYIYNTRQDVDALINGLYEVKKVFA